MQVKSKANDLRNARRHLIKARTILQSYQEVTLVPEILEEIEKPINELKLIVKC
jgi:hypothetical protein